MGDSALTLRCDCGEEHAVKTGDERVDCPCGAVYVTTVTRLTSLLDGPGTDED